jgi:vacuolar-type H+-ATPase subunit I/STV1
MSTAKSGYIQRKIVKVCEDIQVQYDQTVRDATGKIYQFAYGDDNYDPIKTVRVNGQVSPCDISRLAERLNTSFECGIDESDDDTGPEITASMSSPILNIVQNTNKISPEKQKLIDKIKRTNPQTVIDEDWTVSELRQRLQAMEDVDSESGDIDEDCSELEDETYSTVEDEEREDEENIEDQENIEEDSVEDDGGDVSGGDYDECEF